LTDQFSLDFSAARGEWVRIAEAVKKQSLSTRAETAARKLRKWVSSVYPDSTRSFGFSVTVSGYVVKLRSGAQCADLLVPN
jgi:hypothetical protein